MTREEMANVAGSLAEISRVSFFKVDSYPDRDEKRRAFFDKAKLWHVIKDIISVLYIEKLAKGELVLKDEDGNEYKVVQIKEEQHAV
jgi:hypothetical protein